MASIITASASSGLTQSADTSGVLQLASGVGNLVTIPSVTGTAMVSGNMPAFSAYVSGTGSTTFSLSTLTKVALNAKTFDTNSNFDATTNYRFTPTVAGYYQINGSVSTNWNSSQWSNYYVYLYKNGSEYCQSTFYQNTTLYPTINIATLIYFNGSTDYIELYVQAVGGSQPQWNNGSNRTYMTGFLVRAA